MSDDPPMMFRHPTDPPAPLPPLRGSEHIVRIHSEWARLHAATPTPESFTQRARARTKLVAARVIGGSDRRFLGDLVRAIDEVAARCDELTERVSNLATTADDLARSISEEVTRLRATVDCLGTPDRSSEESR
jgi:hypothetical protein